VFASGSQQDFVPAGLPPPESVDVRVWGRQRRARFLVLPRRPAGTEGWSEEQLAGLVTRAGMIGTAAV
jgi:nitrile hydratase